MKVNLDFLKSKAFWKELVMMTVGLLIGAAAVYYFLVPSNLVIGTISGLAIVIAKLLAGVGVTIKVSMLILAMNALLILLAFMCLGSEMGIKTVFASLLLGPFMDIWEKIYPYERLIEPGMTSVMGEPIFDLLGFVVLLGASQAFLFRINASTGGLDIVALMMKKYLHWEIGTSVTVAGFAVVASAFLIQPFRLVVIGLIGTWVNGLVVDYFTASLNKRKRVCIISGEHEKIRQYIIDELYRGCSLYDVKGGYSGDSSVEIQTLLTQSEFANLMEFIRKNEINAFITAGNCSEIYGLWHSREQISRLRQERMR
ncbi:MAG: YitT family protein [Bacteroidales bacterium]|nr:YitT family protein [Bacteroidales bacterium]